MVPRELFLRIISGLVLAPIVLAAIWFGGIYLTILLSLMSALMGWEWGTICSRGQPDWRRWVLAGLGPIAVASGYVWYDYSTIVLGLSVTACLFPFLGHTTQRKDWFWWFAGPIFCAAGPALMLYLRDDPGLLPIVYWLVVVTWATDIGAYFVGRALGGPKLWPSISPGKTWSGAAGGILIAIISSTLFIIVWNWLEHSPYSDVDFWAWLQDYAAEALPYLIGFAALFSAIGQMGDLFESALKRHFGVKDSGHLIPGHGGILDRVDALTMNALAFTSILLLWELLTYGAIGVDE